MLTDDQIDFYRQQGYLLVPNLFTSREVADLNAVTDRFREESRTVSASDNVFDVGPGHSAEDPQLRRIKDPVLRHKSFDTAMRHPKLLAVLQQLLGRDLRFDHSKLNIKPVGGGAEIDWHQDWAFYPHTNDDLLAVGLMLDDVGPANGPLQVIPGSHLGPTHNHHSDGVFCGAITDTDAAEFERKAVPLTGGAGSITLHHVRTIHGSAPNTGDHDRRLLLFSYAAVDAWPLVPETDLESFDARILTGGATLAPRQVAVPVRLPLPRVESDDSIFDNQAHKKDALEPV